MINWIASFKIFTMETTQVSRLRKKWLGCSANGIPENNESANQSKRSVPRQYHEMTWQNSRITLLSPFSENAGVFSEIA